MLGQLAGFGHNAGADHCLSRLIGRPLLGIHQKIAELSVRQRAK
jgi:hypothetical protein